MSVAITAKSTVTICAADDSCTPLDSTFSSDTGIEANLSSADRRSPNISNNSIIIPFVHPKPSCTSYSPPPP